MTLFRFHILALNLSAQEINRKHKEAGEPEKVLRVMVDSGG